MKIKYLLFTVVLFAACQTQAQNWLNNLEKACSIAKAENKLVLVDFYADWCGPCKTMDRETWSQHEVLQEMSKVIAVKIDIDLNKSLALNYGVKAIPDVFILDAWGNKLYEIKGFQSAPKMTTILNGLPADSEKLYASLNKLEDEPKGAELILEVAMSFQESSKLLTKKGKDIFIRNSYAYLNRAKKAYKKQKDDLKLEEIELLKCYNDVLLERSKAALGDIEKMGIDNIQPENKQLAWFIAAQAYNNEGNETAAKELIEKLKGESGETNYLVQLKEDVPELF